MEKALKIASVGISLLLVFLAAGYFSGARQVAAEGQVVGYVNSDRILEEYEPAVKVNNELVELRKQSEKELEAMVREKFGPGDISTLPREQQLEVQQMVEKAETGFDEKSEQLREKKWIPLVDKVNAVIEKVAAEEKVQVVLEEASVIYGGVDLSEKVLQKLNEQEK